MKMLLLFSPFALVEEGLISLLMLIDAKIYGLFAKLYSLYLDLAMARIFDISTFDNVIKNVYVIFGVIALFIVVFSLLQAMVNPEDVSKGTKTTKDVIKRLILCVGLTCVVPFAFDFLYDFQFSLLKFQVIPKTMIGIQGSDNISYSEEYTDGEGNQGTISGQINASDFTKSGLQVYGNQMAFYVLNGFFFANDLDSDGTPDEVIVEASEHFGSDNGLVGGAIGCIGGVVITGILALTGVGIPAAATTGAGTAAICAGGVVAGVVIDGALETITAEEFSWRAVSQNLIPYFGEFDLIAPFSEAVVNGTMSYTPIISTIAGIIMLYMMFSFCLDLGVRAAKLVFYQIMAPISFLLSILPKNKDLMSTWFKAVLSTWAEVFVRIICVCGAALLISNLNFDELSNFGLIARAIIVLGIVAFAKQAPKLFGEVTGIKSANIKLGIKDKLAAGGAFTAGAIVGGGATAFTRNLTNKWAHADNWKNKDGKVTAGSVMKNIGSGLLSASAGTASAQFRAGKAGINAKSFKDMTGAATSGAKGAETARDKRAAYKASHGDSFIPYVEKDANGKSHINGAAWGHVTDTVRNVGEWAGFSTSAAEVEGYYTKAANVSKAYNDAVEKTYKTKDAYIELDNKVKALKNLKKSGGATAAEEAELIRLENSLKQMRIDESMKKVTNIRSAAYQLAYDHKMNYYSDKEMVAEFESGLSDGFFDKKGSTATLIGLNAAGEYEFDVKDANGIITRMSLDADTYKVYDAMKQGIEFDERLINTSNIIRIQDAIDNVNIHRQNLNTRKADEAFRAKQEKKKQEGK